MLVEALMNFGDVATQRVMQVILTAHGHQVGPEATAAATAAMHTAFDATAASAATASGTEECMGGAAFAAAAQSVYDDDASAHEEESMDAAALAEAAEAVYGP
jgi:hypothetical protein